MEHITPIISVIIPLYNKEAIIEQSVRSVLSQSFVNFELIIVNDGSTDCSSEIVCEIKDKRIRFIEQENAGSSAARNKGAQNAKADWIVFLDADDELLPGALEHFYHLTSILPQADMVLGEVYINYKENRYLKKKYSEGFVCNIFKAHVNNLLMQCSGSTLYKKEMVERYPYNEQIRRYEDLETLFRKYKTANLYTTHYPVASINIDFAEASKGRKDISEDFVGHIDLANKSFWEKLAYYKLFFEEHAHYPKQSRQLYPHLFKRYDLYLICILLGKISKYKILNKLFLSIIGNPIKGTK